MTGDGKQESGVRGKCDTCPAQCNSVFANLRRTGIRSFDRIRTLTTFTKGQVIDFQKRDRPGFFCIEAGHVKLTYRRGPVDRPLRICGPGDLIGYGSWHKDNQGGAVAIDPCSACFFDKDQFLLMQEKAPKIGSEIIKVLCEVILQKSERIVALEGTSVKSRVAATLMVLNIKFGVPSKFGSMIAPRVDRKTLAELSGTVIESFARVLTEFENQGLVVRKGRSLHICDADRLHRIAWKPRGCSPLIEKVIGKNVV